MSRYLHGLAARTLILATATLCVLGALAAGPARAGGEAGSWPATVFETAEKIQQIEGSRSNSQRAQAIAAEVLGDRQLTLYQLTLTRGVVAEVYSLADPYRVVIDLPDLDFKLPEDAGRTARGLVKAYRYGQFAEGKARIVLDTDGPVTIAKAQMSHAREGGGVIFALEFTPVDAATFGAGTGGSRAEKEYGATDAEPARPAGRSKPVVLIDPGHGGVDPGAVGAGNILEKDLVLSVARKLRNRLAASGKYDVHMTRNRDVFVSLNGRLKMSRELSSDLFISVHADSIEQAEWAQIARGATVYTLSERASDSQARAMADKENASDLLAGLQVSDVEESDQVKNILIDLMKRETANFSADFSRTLVHKMKSTVSLSKDPQRSAAFKVLKQTHAPSVLIELGYVSNEQEAKLMSSMEWQDKISRSISAAVDTFFSRRAPGRP